LRVWRRLRASRGGDVGVLRSWLGWWVVGAALWVPRGAVAVGATAHSGSALGGDPAGGAEP